MMCFLVIHNTFQHVKDFEQFDLKERQDFLKNFFYYIVLFLCLNQIC